MTRTIERIPVTTERLIEHLTCDLCGAKGTVTCLICKQQACDAHSHRDYQDHYNYGNFFESYCKPCWEAGEAYRANEAAREQASDYEYEVWHRDAKAAAERRKAGK